MSGWLMVLLACKGADDPSSPPVTMPTAITGATAGTGDTGGRPTTDGRPVVVEAPVLSWVGELAPLSGTLTLTVDRPVAAVLHIDDGERVWSTPIPGEGTVLDLPVIGGRSGRTLSVTAELTPSSGESLTVDAGTLTLPALDPLFSKLSLEAADPSRMEPGYTLVPVLGHIGLVDPGGELVWMARSVGSVHELLPSSEGSMAYRYLSNRTQVIEVDVRGQRLRSWHAAQATDVPGSIPVDVLALHHDVQALPDGTFLVLSVERRLLDYPTSERLPDAPLREVWVAGDVVVNFAADGTVLQQWSMLDLLDPMRIGFDSVDGNYWDDFDAWQPDGARDWSHGNAVSYDPTTDRVLVGLRHQDAVVAFERSSGVLSWILAPPDLWRAPWSSAVLDAADDVAILPYHMHGAKWTASGTLALFDNGNYRAPPFQPPLSDQDNASRAVEYAIDEVTHEFRELWSYTTPEELFVGSLGDVDILPTTDNVLVTWGNIKTPDPRGVVRIQELTRDHETVFDLWLPSGTVFRAQRVPGLIP